MLVEKHLQRISNLSCVAKTQMTISRDRAHRFVQREVLDGFTEMVWRYPDVQFREDFRMPRRKFQVLLY